MSQAAITFNLNPNGLGQPPLGTDYIRGLQLYGTAPGSFGTTATQAVYSLSDAETKGITNNYSDETAATGTYEITTKGATGDTINITITEPNPNSTSTDVDLGTYTIVSGDSTIALLGASLAAFINAGTYIHGYSATFNTATLTITARQGMGIALNSGSPITVTATGTHAGTTTQFSGGAYSKKAIWHYHISEYFRAYPNGKLWINFTSSPSSNFTELTTLVNASEGECKAIGVYSFTARTVAQVASDLTAMQAIAVTAAAAYKWCNFIYAPNIAAVTDLSTLKNGQTYTNYYTNVCVGQDGDGAGAQLYVNSGVSISCIGNLLGTSSKAAVSQNIGEVGAFNLTDGTELAVPAFSNGSLASSLATSLLDQLDGYRYIFLTTYTGYSGTFYNNDYSFCVQTSDYNTLSRNLTIGKAQRGVYSGTLPLLKSRLYLNADGTLTNTTSEQFRSAGYPALNQMVVDGDLSAQDIIVDPTQDVLSTNTVAETIKLLPVGIANYIEVNIGYVPKL